MLLEFSIKIMSILIFAMSTIKIFQSLSCLFVPDLRASISYAEFWTLRPNLIGFSKKKLDTHAYQIYNAGCRKSCGLDCRL